MVYLDVKQYLANQRQEPINLKNAARLLVQPERLKKKGTGTARAEVSTGIFRGGGRMFGPRPRNYSFKLNKNLKNYA